MGSRSRPEGRRELSRRAHQQHPRDVLEPSDEERPRYSICTMVTRPEQYEAMVASFEAAGFREPLAEYLYLDNTSSNRLDAYAAIRRFLQAARGDYVILCHQDIVLHADRIERLEASIRELDRLDPSWGLLGNAGGEAPFRTVARITDPNGERTAAGLPRAVHSLDENFILLRRDCTPGVSRDLEGFHFYGLDLCRQAALRGYRAYVVDFHLKHLSAGRRDGAFREARARVVAKYRRALASGYFQTTVTTVYLSGSRVWSAILNSELVMKWRRSLQKRLGTVDPRGR
jgi:hypothetical protein